MRNKKTLVISLIMLLSVLIGVTIIHPLVEEFKWIEPFQPMIVITGFFVFLVSASLFIYSIISNLNK